MPVLTKHRWLRYSIRTLLVAVTIFCVWLGWQFRIVRERKAVLDLVQSRRIPSAFSKYVTGLACIAVVAVVDGIAGWVAMIFECKTAWRLPVVIKTECPLVHTILAWRMLDLLLTSSMIHHYRGKAVD